MPLDISCRYLLLKTNRGVCQQYRQYVRMSRTQWIEGLKYIPSRCGNNTDRVRILHKMKSN